MRKIIVVVLFIMLAGCTRVARPAAELMQAWLGGYHVAVDVAAPGAALVSARGVALTGAAEARFSLTAPGEDGTRKTLVERGVRAGEFGAWRIVLFDAGHERWIRVERIGCDAARELFPELPPCAVEDPTMKAAGVRPVVVEDVVVERVRM